MSGGFGPFFLYMMILFGAPLAIIALVIVGNLPSKKD